MHTIGLVSVSFRKHTPEEILQAASHAGLAVIEWGSDVHAPRNDIARLEQLVQLQNRHQIRCCSYGTYFYLGRDSLEELPEYIAAAKVLGTSVLRLWCGTKSPWEYTGEEKEALFAQCRSAAALAERENVTLCMECHMRTYTETAESALELMAAVDSPAFRMYWQPNQNRTIKENVQNAVCLQRFVERIHVFQWKGTEKFPLAQGIEEWQAYLRRFSGPQTLLLEFMPDNDIKSLPAEAKALMELKGVSL